MEWSRWISSTATQIVLTVTIFVTALFVMGFVADPIINLYADPYSVLTAPTKVASKIEPILTDDDVATWAEHFLKGLAATGLLGFIKVFFALSPWQWWNIRGSGILGGHRSGNTGRDRMASISWIVVVVGVVTFLLVSQMLNAINGDLLTFRRQFTKAFAPGVDARWRKLARGSWT